MAHSGAPPRRIALVGTRGVPARYGGFETAIEEVGKRLVQRGHHVTVYCRSHQDPGDRPRHHEGMHLVHLPALRSKAVETLSHTALSTAHAMVQQRHDAVFVFNAANAPFVPLFQLRGMPVALHVDGLEWKRGKWGKGGRNYYRRAEEYAVRRADALIADSPGIVQYYEEEFEASTVHIAYGAPILSDVADDRLASVGVTSKGFHLAVARFEPENNFEMIVRGYRASDARLPLVVVGSAPYADDYTRIVRSIADSDPRVRLIGSVWDQVLLDQLYAHTLLYLHGHSIGGTNPSLLRASGAGAPVAAFDVVFNRTVLGDHGVWFRDERSVLEAVEHAEAEADEMAAMGRRGQERVSQRYSWDDVTDRYEALATNLATGTSRRGEATGRRAGVW